MAVAGSEAQLDGMGLSKTIAAAGWAVGFASFWASTTLLAQVPERERAAISLGAFITNPQVEARVDSDSGTGTDIDFEDDLGLDSSTTIARLDSHWWLSRRNRLDFSVFSFHRSGERLIDETIHFGDEVFLINTIVSSSADLNIVKAAYTFAPVIKDRGFLGITAGLYVAQSQLTLGEATLGSVESEELTAPLPVVGVRGAYQATDRITLRGSVELFGIDTGDVSGRLDDFYIAADYGLGDRFAVGLAYNNVTASINADEGGSGFRGALDWGYDGWLLYFSLDIAKE